MTRKPSPKVIVVGGGYAGAIAAVRLAGRARGRAQVTLVDPREALVQRLRLHQVAAGQDVASYDLRKLTGRRVANVRGRAHEIDLGRSRIRVSGSDGAHELPFDWLILATGSVIDVGAVPGVREHAHTLTDPASAERLRVMLRHLRAGDVVAVCGGGLTGLEAAAEIAGHRPDVEVVLVTAGDLGDRLSERGRVELAARLGRIGIRVVERTRVTEVESDRIVTDDGGSLRVDATVWCGGFLGHSLAWNCGLPVDGRGALRVDATLRSVSHPQVFAAGDAAAVPPLPNGSTFRMTCQAGMPAGAHAADSVTAALEGREPEPFDFGYIHQPISLGRRDGLIQFVDRTDRPVDRLLTGRRAAAYKEIVTRTAVPSIAFERRFPGALRWPSGGNESARTAPVAAGSTRRHPG